VCVCVCVRVCECVCVCMSGNVHSMCVHWLGCMYIPPLSFEWIGGYVMP